MFDLQGVMEIINLIVCDNSPYLITIQVSENMALNKRIACQNL